MVKAFSDELQKDFNTSFISQRIASKFVCSLFEEVVNEFSDKIESKEITPDKAVKEFKNRLKQEIIQKNNERLEVDRETFRDLMGKAVNGGKGKMPDIPFTSEIKQLIKDYNARYMAKQRRKNYFI